MKALAVRWGLENGEAGRFCREAFGLGLGVLRVQPTGAVGRRIGFALLGEFLLAVAPKGTKKSCPSIRVSLRSTALVPSLLRGPAYKGHPWPFTPLAASMPLAPLRSDSIRPSERGVWCRLPGPACSNQRNALDLTLLEKLQATRSGFPFRRPSTGVAQGGSRHGCRERSDGTWMSLRDAPRSNAGARGVLRSKTRMQGWPSFWLLFLGHTRKSDAPCKAQPVGGAEESGTPPYLRPSLTGSYRTPRVMVPQC